MSEAAKALAETFEQGIWDEHPEFPAEDWRHEAANDETRQSYWDWVLSRQASEDEEEEDDWDENDGWDEEE